MSKRVLCVMVLGITLALAGAVQAAPITWDGGNANWHASNWGGGNPPVAGSDYVIGGGADGTAYAAGTGFAGDKLTVKSGGVVSVTQDTTAGTDMDLDGGKIEWLTDWRDLHGLNTVTVLNASELYGRESATFQALTALNGSGDLTVTGNGSDRLMWDVRGGSWSGTMTIEQNAILETPRTSGTAYPAFDNAKVVTKTGGALRLESRETSDVFQGDIELRGGALQRTQASAWWDTTVAISGALDVLEDGSSVERTSGSGNARTVHLTGLLGGSGGLSVVNYNLNGQLMTLDLDPASGAGTYSGIIMVSDDARLLLSDSAALPSSGALASAVIQTGGELELAAGVGVQFDDLTLDGETVPGGVYTSTAHLTSKGISPGAAALVDFSSNTSITVSAAGAPIAEPTGLGLLGLALMRLRMRKR